MHLNSLKKKVVLDIGCNDGSLLDYFRAKGCRTIGIEPTDAFIDAKTNGHVVYNTFLSSELAKTICANHGDPDIITFTNVFAHIENLDEVINSLKILSSSTTTLVIENHYLGSIFEKNQFDTFYHEHPRTYSCTSFIEIAKRLNMEIQALEFPSRYGGNIRIFLSNDKNFLKTHNDLPGILKEEKNYFSKFSEMNSNMNKWLTKKKKLIQQLTEDQPLIAKAFPGRAAILIKMLGLDEKNISSVFEKPGSMKIGHFLPGTRIPIKSDDELFAYHEKPKKILNLAWHISKEIKAYLLENNITTEIINIVDSEDY